MDRVRESMKDNEQKAKAQHKKYHDRMKVTWYWSFYPRGRTSCLLSGLDPIKSHRKV